MHMKTWAYKGALSDPNIDCSQSSVLGHRWLADFLLAHRAAGKLCQHPHRKKKIKQFKKEDRRRRLKKIRGMRVEGERRRDRVDEKTSERQKKERLTGGSKM